MEEEEVDPCERATFKNQTQVVSYSPQLKPASTKLNTCDKVIADLHRAKKVISPEKNEEKPNESSSPTEDSSLSDMGFPAIKPAVRSSYIHGTSMPVPNSEDSIESTDLQI